MVSASAGAVIPEIQRENIMRKVYSGLAGLPSGRSDESITEGILVLEGGAWKGVYSVGVVDALMANDINFRTTVGISAGAMTGLAYLSGQIGLSARVDLKHRFDTDYCGLKALRHDNGVIGFSYLYNRIMPALGYDWKAAGRTQRRLVVGATNLLTGEADYFETGRDNIFRAVRASASMPFLSSPVMIGGTPYLDGGCAEKIPYRWAAAQGERKIVVVKTREWDYRRKEGRNLLARRVYRKYPAFVESIESTNGKFNRMTDELMEEYRAGRIFAIAPSRAMNVSRFERDIEKLGELYWLGFNDMQERIDELREYLES